MAQEIDDLFPELLVGDDDRPPITKPIPKGNFTRIDGDWILCTGQFGKGEPPSGPNFQIEFNQKNYDNIAVFNNEAVGLALSATTTPANLNQAESMWLAGYENDPHFFAFNYNLARLNTIRNQFKKALFYAERAASMMPGDYRLDLLLASLYEHQSQDIAAHHHYKEAVRKNPFSATALVSLAGFYSRTDKQSLAEDLLRRGMDRFETDHQLRLGLAELRYKQYRLNQARILVESIDIAETDRSAFALRRLLLMAKLYDRIGDYRRSAISYSTLLTTTTEPFFIDKNVAALQREKERVERLAKVK